MKISVKSDGHNLSIPVPTGWLFSKPSAWLWLKMMRMFSKKMDQYGNDFYLNLPDEAVYAICAELKRTRKKYGKWTLVEVKSACGEEVTITL